MPRRRPQSESVISLSFLDTACGGFGALLFLFLAVASQSVSTSSIDLDARTAVIAIEVHAHMPAGGSAMTPDEIADFNAAIDLLIPKHVASIDSLPLQSYPNRAYWDSYTLQQHRQVPADKVCRELIAPNAWVQPGPNPDRKRLFIVMRGVVPNRFALRVRITGPAIGADFYSVSGWVMTPAGYVHVANASINTIDHTVVNQAISPRFGLARPVQIDGADVLRIDPRNGLLVDEALLVVSMSH